MGISSTEKEEGGGGWGGGGGREGKGISRCVYVTMVGEVGGDRLSVVMGREMGWRCDAGSLSLLDLWRSGENE